MVVDARAMPLQKPHHQIIDLGLEKEEERRGKGGGGGSFPIPSLHSFLPRFHPSFTHHQWGPIHPLERSGPDYTSSSPPLFLLPSSLPPPPLLPSSYRPQRAAGCN